MLKLAGLAGLLAATAVCAADETHRFTFTATITSVEGTIPPPQGVGVGSQVEMTYRFIAQTPDAEPSPQIGSYVGAVRSPVANLAPLALDNLAAGPISIVNDAAGGDIYRLILTNATDGVTVGVMLQDLRSIAFASDALPTTLSLKDFNHDFGGSGIVVQSSGADYWRVRGTVEFFEGSRYFCRCDWDQDDAVNSQDFFEFLVDFFAGDADYNHDGVTSSQDFFDFLACFFAPEFACR